MRKLPYLLRISFSLSSKRAFFIPTRPLKNQYVEEIRQCACNYTVIQETGAIAWKMKVHLGNNYDLLSMQAPYAILRLLHSLFSLNICLDHL